MNMDESRLIARFQVPKRHVEGRSTRFVARRIGEAQQPRCCAAPLFKNGVPRHAQRFARGGVTDGQRFINAALPLSHLVHCRGIRQMLTSEQMLLTMALFGHVLIAGITLLIAVTLDDPL